MKQMFLGAAALAAAIALAPVAFAHPMGGGMGHGGFGGGFGHAGMGRMGGGFGHADFGGFRHSGMSRMGGLHHASFRHSGMNHHLRTAHTSHHHGRSGLMPAGFSHGKASWKQNGGTPPGWSKGKKKGWNCTPGLTGCVPPGLSNG